MKSTDALITGLGFALPGPGGLCASSADFWDVISTGATHVLTDGVYFGRVAAGAQQVAERYPELPAKALKYYAPAHFYGLISMAEACTDAKLDWRAGALNEAAVLVARNGGDCWVKPHLDIMTADPDQLSVNDLNALGTRMALSGMPMDVASVQMSLLGNTGSTFTLSSGCSSSAILLGLAQRMIAAGETDVAVVSGVDHYGVEVITKYARLAQAAGATLEAMEGSALEVTQQMRPYDENSPGANMGNGSVTVILESRERAERRGATPYAQLIAQHTQRSPLHSAFAMDMTGAGVVEAARRCMAGNVEPESIDYVNGGAEGDPVFHEIESAVLATLFGDQAATMPVSVQEACFGHSGGPLGALGAAATALMVSKNEICPTAACVTPAQACRFDVVTGEQTRRAQVDHALSFNYTIGMISSAMLLGKP